MTDRIHSLVVVLKNDLRVDDAQQLIDAILMIRGVGYVETMVSDITSLMAEVRAKQDLRTKVFEALK